MGLDTGSERRTPRGLAALLAIYAGRDQQPVRYRPSSWRLALDGVPGDPAELLSSPDFSAETACERFQPKGDRDVTRADVVRACAGMRLDIDADVIRAFVLVMAWGSGTTNGRSLRNTAKALGDVASAASVLRESVHQFRSAEDFRDALDAYQSFKLPGVRESFFSKWFAFAGRNPERDWQPIILDSRVRSTLNKTLGVRLNQLAERRNDPYRYIAYLKAMHDWAGDSEGAVSAERLEWIGSAAGTGDI